MRRWGMWTCGVPCCRRCRGREGRWGRCWARTGWGTQSSPPPPTCAHTRRVPARAPLAPHWPSPQPQPHPATSSTSLSLHKAALTAVSVKHSPSDVSAAKKRIEIAILIFKQAANRILNWPATGNKENIRRNENTWNNKSEMNNGE